MGCDGERVKGDLYAAIEDGQPILLTPARPANRNITAGSDLYADLIDWQLIRLFGSFHFSLANTSRSPTLWIPQFSSNGHHILFEFSIFALETFVCEALSLFLEAFLSILLARKAKLVIIILCLLG